MRSQILILSLLSSLAVKATPTPQSTRLAPLLGEQSSQTAGSYVVVLNPAAQAADHHQFVAQMHLEQFPQSLLIASTTPSGFHGLGHIYSLEADDADSAPHFSGYSLHNVTDDLVNSIRLRPDVAYVEHDSIFTIQDKIPEWATEKVVKQSSVAVEKGAPWGLARISHRKPLSLGTFNKYVYDERAGQGIDVFVIDTGINIEHEEFEGRAHWGKTIPNGAHDFDGNGHGTHCAGTIGSRKYGVAKAARIHAVKVLGDNGSGSMSDVVSGVLWAASTASKMFKEGSSNGAVGSMSLGGGRSRALDDVVDRVVANGLSVAAAGGNENQDACNCSPSASKRAVTVGASTIWDIRASFSNWGKCTDIFAPGLNILSTWTGGKNAVNTISGTSMAAPHIAGLMAYMLSNYIDDLAQEELNQPPTKNLYGILPFTYMPKAVEAAMRIAFPSAAQKIFGSSSAPIPRTPVDPALLKASLLEMASQDLLSDVGEGSPNALAFNNATE